jgi:Rieske Fe-S protein
MPEGMYLTEESPLRSFRRQRYFDRELLIIGSYLHKVGQEENTAAFFEGTEEWARENFGAKDVLFRWSTQDNMTPDGLPFVGPSPNRERIYIATGFNGWGMTNGIVASRLLSTAILGATDPWQDIYDPTRVTWSAVPTLLKENLDTAAHYFGDRMSRVEKSDPAALSPGQAAVLQLRDRRVCAFRDQDGRLHAVSSACTHMGCQLHWNNVEESWDCPCHGSRFDADGNVLHAPAVTPLPKLDIEHERAAASQDFQTAVDG